jgi:hypothetical protein
VVQAGVALLRLALTQSRHTVAALTSPARPRATLSTYVAMPSCSQFCERGMRGMARCTISCTMIQSFKNCARVVSRPTRKRISSDGTP